MGYGIEEEDLVKLNICRQELHNTCWLDISTGYGTSISHHSWKRKKDGTSDQ